jgi:calcium permeable stress-gated cation channel
MFLFIFLRRKNKVSPFSMLSTHVPKPHFYQVFYEPKVKYYRERPPWVSSGLLGWMSLLFRVKEPEIIDKVGLDAAAFLRFIRMMRIIFVLVAFFGCAIIIPINVSYNLRFVPSSERDYLSMLTIRDVRGSYLWAHVIMTYIITATVIVVVRYNWSVMVDLRAQYFLSPEYLHSFDPTLTVTHIPETSQSEEGVRALLNSVKVPYPITDVHIGRRLEDLPRLIKVHNNTIRKLEQKMVRYLKGGKFGKKRPTVRVGGFLGMGGEVRDAIDHYTCVLLQHRT